MSARIGVQALTRFGATLFLDSFADGGDAPPLEVSAAAVDSRRITPGAIFAALPGRFSDGHDYLEDAAARGAAILLLDAERADTMGHTLDALRERARILVVSDVLAALQGLAAEHLDRNTSAVRIGITGSNGKTSTKEMLFSILSQVGYTFRSEGNLNSEIGVALAALSVEETHRYAVFEMAMDHAGEMAQLARIVRPSHAVVTNTADAHTEFVGGRERVAGEKRMIYSQTAEGGFAYIPADDACAAILSDPAFLAELGATPVYVGRDALQGFEGYRSRGLAGGDLFYRGRTIHVRLPGAFVADNALCAIAVAEKLGVSPDAIARGLEAVRPLFGRGEVHEGRITVLSDCYNANPQSMQGALATVASSDIRGRIVLILGDMKELADSRSQHERLGRDIACLVPQPAVVVFVGPETEYSLAAARGEGCRAEITHVPDVQAAFEPVKRLVRDGDTVLLKGSRSLELERLLPLLGVEGGGHVS